MLRIVYLTNQVAINKHTDAIGANLSAVDMPIPRLGTVYDHVKMLCITQPLHGAAATFWAPNQFINPFIQQADGEMIDEVQVIELVKAVVMLVNSGEARVVKAWCAIPIATKDQAAGDQVGRIMHLSPVFRNIRSRYFI